MKTTEQTVDTERLEALLGQAVVDCGATANAALVVIGEELGLYRALAEHGPLTPDRLAAHTNTTERYVREWLGAQAASGYVRYDPATQRYAMSPEQVMAFADETSPVFLPGAFEVAIGFVRAGEHIRERFLSGHGYGWHNRTRSCTAARSASSAAATRRTSQATGSPPSTACRSACAQAAPSPTSAAATAPLRS